MKIKKSFGRSFRQVLHDVWLAVRGKTFVTLSGCCHACGEDFYIEVYQDLNHPLPFGKVGIAYGNFNDVMYFPSIRAWYEHNGAVYERLDPKKFPGWKNRKRVTWKATLGPSYTAKRPAADRGPQNDGSVCVPRLLAAHND